MIHTRSLIDVRERLTRDNRSVRSESRSYSDLLSTALAELIGAVWFWGVPCKGSVRPNG